MIQVPIRTTKPDFTVYKISGHCKPRCYTLILLINTVRVLWTLYVRIQLHTYRAPSIAVFVPYLDIQLPSSCIRRYGANDIHIKLPRR